jgi:hypothetical protein
MELVMVLEVEEDKEVNVVEEVLEVVVLEV